MQLCVWLLKQKIKPMSDPVPHPFNEQLFEDYLNQHEKSVQHFRKHALPVIKSALNLILDCFGQKGKIILAGNGGSAADCQHITGELLGRYKKNRVPLPAISLTTDTSVITCIANDFEFESVFSRPLKALGQKQDVLWLFSTSGTSPNIIKAAETASKMGMKILSFTGKPHSDLETMSDVCLCANTHDTGHAQEIHQLAYHIICSYIDQYFTED